MSNISSPFNAAFAQQGLDPFRLLVESVVDYAIYMVDPARRIVSWNPGAERIYGYPAQEIIGQSVANVFAPPDGTDNRLDELWQQALASGHDEVECLGVRRDKSQFTAAVTVSTLNDHSGSHAGFSVVARLVSEESHPGLPDIRHEAESVPHRNTVEQQFIAMVEGIKDYAIYMMNSDGIITSWNEGAERIFGFAAGEILGRHRNLLFTPEDVAAGAAQAEQHQAMALGSLIDDRWRVRKDGSRFWANGGMAVLRDDQAMVRGFIKILRDLTAQKLAEAALQESEERYRSLFDAISDPLFVYDRETLAYLAVNNAAVQQYGYSRDEFLGMTIKDIRPVEDVAALLEMLAAAGTGFEHRGVWRHRKHDGTILEVEISAHGLEYAGRRACVIQARDITEKRRAAAEAARTNALLQAVADGMSDAVFVKDLGGKYLLFNKAASQFVGKPVEEVLGNDDTAIFDPESARIAMESDRLVMEANQAQMWEQRLTAAGVMRIYETMKSPHRDASGHVVGVIGVSREITDRKRAEEELRQQQALLRIAGRVASIGGWSLDLAHRKSLGRMKFVRYTKFLPIISPRWLKRSNFSLPRANSE